MKRSWFVTLVVRLKERWDENFQRRQERAKERREAHRESRRHVKSRWTGFVRFYGRRALEVAGRGWAILGEMRRRHRERTRLQRSLLGVTVMGIVAAFVLNAGWNPLIGLAPWGSLLPDQWMSDANRGERQTQKNSAESDQPATTRGVLESRGSESAADSGPGVAGQGRTLQEASPSDVRPSPRTEPPSPPRDDGPEDVSGSAARPTPSLPAVAIGSMQWPLLGDVARPFGWYRHPVFGDWRHSSAVVLYPAEERRPVHAALAGRVRDVVSEGGLWRITIEHAGGWFTEYQGLIETKVDSFAVVQTGQEIGVAGGVDPREGIAFSVRRGDVAVDPRSLIEPSAVPVRAP